MAPQNPWGRVPPCLKGKVVTQKEKEWVAHLVNSKNKKQKDLAKALGISRSVIGKWSERYRLGLPVYNAGGRPPSFDSPAKRHIAEVLGGEKRIQLNAEQADALYKTQFAATAVRRNQAECQHQSLPDRRTVKKMEEQLGVHDVYAEETTDARELSCADIRNATAVMVQLVQPELSPRCAARQL